MKLISTYRWIFAIVRLILLLITTTFVVMVVYLYYLEGIVGFNIALKIFTSLIVIFAVIECIFSWYKFLHFFPRIYVSDEGLSFRAFFGLGPMQFYSWKEISGYRTGSFVIVKAFTYNELEIFYDGMCILRFDEASYDNYEELKTVVEKNAIVYEKATRELKA